MDWAGDGECRFFFSLNLMFFLSQHFAGRTGNISLNLVNIG